MRKLLITGVAGLALAFAAFESSGAHAEYLIEGGPQIELRDMIARVVVTPEDRSDIDIRVRYGAAKVPTLMVSQRGNVTVLNGHMSTPPRGGGFALHINVNDDSDVSSSNGTVYISGLGKVNISDLPLVYVRVPANAVVKDSAYIFGRVGPSRSLDFTLNGSGEWMFEPVSGPLNIISNGSGTLTATSAGDSIVDIMGSGDVKLGQTRNLKIALAGSGNLTAGNAGDVQLQNQGSSDVTLGNVGSLRASLNGSGDLSLNGVNGGFNIVNNGASDIHAVRVNGPVMLDLSGSGDVQIDGGQAPTFIVRGSGSGDVSFGGVTNAVNVDSNGSGDVSILRATGQVITRVVGSGEMHIGH